MKKAQPLNIDDIPIPTANAIKPKSFDELLREQLKLEGQDSGEFENNPEEGQPKREFLRRKKPLIVPPKQS